MVQMKAKEKEMKDEKDELRRVGVPGHDGTEATRRLTCFAATDPGPPREASQERRKGKIREDGREDAPKASRAVEAKGEAEQAVEFLSGRAAMDEWPLISEQITVAWSVYESLAAATDWLQRSTRTARSMIMRPEEPESAAGTGFRVRTMPRELCRQRQLANDQASFQRWSFRAGSS